MARQVTTADLGLPGFQGTQPQPLSTYDNLRPVASRHDDDGHTPVSRRNGAHQDPLFLPGHRLMLMLVERNIQRVPGFPDSACRTRPGRRMWSDPFPSSPD